MEFVVLVFLVVWLAIGHLLARWAIALWRSNWGCEPPIPLWVLTLTGICASGAVLAGLQEKWRRQ